MFPHLLRTFFVYSFLIFFSHFATAFEGIDTDSDGVFDTIDVDIDGDGLIEINNLQQLDFIRYNLAGTARNNGESDDANGCGNNDDILICHGYELAGDLDFDTNADGLMDVNDTYWNDGEGWVPIGTDDDDGAFVAVLDGNGFSIRNLYINRTSTAFVALFAFADGATIQNISLDGELMSISGNTKVAGFIASSETDNQITFNNCSVSGVISGKQVIGSLLGVVNNIVVSNCHSDVVINSTFALSAGLVGSSYANTLIQNSSFKGQVTNIGGNAAMGGLISEVVGNLNIENSFVMADISSDNSWVGGLVGYIWEGSSAKITNSFYMGVLSGDDSVGGLVGKVFDGTELTLTSSYSIATINANSNAGSLVGDIEGNSSVIDSHSFWDSNITTQTQTADNAGTGHSTNALQVPSNTDIYLTWSTDDWDFGSSNQYPALIINSNIYRDADDDGYWLFEDAFDDDASEYMDSDNDGVGDNTDAFPNDASEDSDSDSDGVGDNSDFYPNDATGSSANEDVDIDDDGLIEIYSLEQLNAIRYDLTGASLSGVTAGCAGNTDGSGCIGFELMNDLNFDTNADGLMDDSDIYWNSGKGWEPMGSSSKGFSATLEGNGFSILNLFINRSTTDYIGLFASVNASIIQNIHLSGELTSITGNNYVGAFSGFQAGSDPVFYKNCSIQGEIYGTRNVGGLQGYAKSAQVDRCNSDAIIQASENSAGGLLGLITWNSSIDNSFVLGSINGASAVGGLVGESSSDFLNLTINNSFSFADVSGSGSYVGGLLGESYGVNTITDSYSTGNISGNDAVGGLVGEQETGNVTIINSYARGTITSVSENEYDYGGLVGYVNGTVMSTDSYWDTTISNLFVTGSNQGTGLTTQQLIFETGSNNIYQNWSANNWDFGTSNQYPVLIIEANIYRDADRDGYWVFEDVFDDDATEYLDSDNDGVGDNEDLDDDNDGYSDLDEIDNGTDSLSANDTPADNDGDFISDLNDDDDDNDLVLDIHDAFPFDASETQDSDNDGIGDNVDNTPYPLIGELQFEFNQYFVSENAATLDIIIKRVEGTYGEISVDYELQDASAVASTDYVFNTGTLTFADGVESQSIQITILDDEFFEGDETFELKLSNMQSVWITIIENENAPENGVIKFEMSTLDVKENAGMINITLIREQGSEGVVSVDINSLDNNAIANDDYEVLSQTVEFAEGETEKTISFNILDDTEYEPTEQFSLLLSNVQGGAVLGQSELQIRILDDDVALSAGVINFVLTQMTVEETQGNFDIELTRTQGDSGSVYVDVEIWLADELIGVEKNVEFIDGESSRLVSFELEDNQVYEGDILYQVILNNVLSADLGNNTTIKLTIEDDELPPEFGVLSFSGTQYEVDESAGILVVSIIRTQGSTGEISVEVDYLSQQQTLVFADGETKQSLTIIINNNDIYEGDQNFSISLNNAKGGVIIIQDSVNVLVIEDENLPDSGQLQFSGNQYNVAEGDEVMTVTIVRVNGSYGVLHVQLQIGEQSSATLDEDYSLIIQDIHFEDGQIEYSFEIKIIENSVKENAKNIVLILVDEQNNELASSEVVIQDNEVTTTSGAVPIWLLLLFSLMSSSLMRLKAW
ncbi:MAG: hypothetical protein HRU38_24720 [Saccharospirillaceae bacterium]|nr:hypothetical protein [Saccharospirillaceae bacterium]